MRMPFGRYKDVELEVIARIDPSYLFWALHNVQWTTPELPQAITHFLRTAESQSQYASLKKELGDIKQQLQELRELLRKAT